MYIDTYLKIIDQLDLALDYVSKNDSVSINHAFVVVDNAMEKIIKAKADEYLLYYREELKKKENINKDLKSIYFNQKINGLKSIHTDFKENEVCKIVDMSDLLNKLHNVRNKIYHTLDDKDSAVIKELTVFYIKVISQIIDEFTIKVYSSDDFKDLNPRQLRYFALYNSITVEDKQNAIRRIFKQISKIADSFSISKNNIIKSCIITC
jgi:hypothetical protein